MIHPFICLNFCLQINQEKQCGSSKEMRNQTYVNFINNKNRRRRKKKAKHANQALLPSSNMHCCGTRAVIVLESKLKLWR